MARIPDFYAPDRVGTLFYPDVEAIAADARRAGLAPAAGDKPRVLFLLVDLQVDFCHRGGALYVPGAEDDLRRVIRFLYTHADRIGRIVCSLDAHYPFQIFHGAWWVDAAGYHPEPFTVITCEDVENGLWRPTRAPEWSCAYVGKLRRKARKELVIWPYHVPLGGLGSALDPELWSAVFWHSIARGSQPLLWTKGGIPGTEHYSILRPEVAVPGRSEGDRRAEFLRLFDESDGLLLAGEAETHCVLETVRDLVELVGEAPEKLARIAVLRDCMSPVRHPSIDFHAQAVERFEAYRHQGLRFVDSADPFPFPP